MNPTTKKGIQIKKFILSDVCRPGYSPSEAIEEILHIVLSQDAASDNSCTTCTTCATCAAEFIFAYLQMGFSYLEHRELFDAVLQKAGMSEAELTDCRKINRPLRLNRSQIRSAIGRWPASPYNSHTITAAVDDIIMRAERHIPGTCKYYTAKKDGSYTALYVLTVYSDYALFHDVFQNRYYCLRHG